MGPKEAEDIKKRGQQYTEELYKKDLNDPDKHGGMITQLETDILRWEVKWALASITENKARGDGVIPAEIPYFSDISNLQRWCCEGAALNMPASLENSAVTKGMERSVSFQS